MEPLNRVHKSKQMAYEQKEGQGSLFKNEEKKSEKHPDYTGEIKLNGQMKRLAAWVKQSKNGKMYMSISVSEKTQGTAQANPNFSDDLPF